jgi:hypothetical protein
LHPLLHSYCDVLGALRIAVPRSTDKDKLTTTPPPTGTCGAKNSDVTMRSTPFWLDIVRARCNSNRWFIESAIDYLYLHLTTSYYIYERTQENVGVFRS